MKHTQVLIFTFLFMLWCNSCSKNDEGSQTLGDFQDITTSIEITPYGGELQATDELGNVITITFPPAAIRDTTTITLTIIGEHMDLPINERHIRAFDIQPYDLSLYKPAIITIEYNSAISGIEESAIYLLRTDEILAPLSDYTYAEGNKTMSAGTLFLGEFAEGKMTIEQINAQLDMLASSMGITWKSTYVSNTKNKRQSSGCEEYKALWDDRSFIAGAFIKFFSMRYWQGYYDDLPPGSRSYDEDIQKVCDNIIQQGVQAVLDLGEPSDPCCSDYAHTIESINQAITFCGGTNSTFDQFNDSYNKVHSECHTYLDITTELNVASGGLLIMTTGEVMIELAGIGDGDAVVTGTGELTVTGSSDSEGDCSATVAGQTFVMVTGIRDAAYVYTLSVQMDQYAIMTTVCPGTVVETPLVGSGTKEITLEPGNGHSISETEMIDEGTVTTQVTLQNPYIPVADSE